jgi:D-methionine transport system substrate-binding protein
MKNIKLFTLITLLCGGLCSCNGNIDNPNKITIAASELPHAKILREAVAPILSDKGYELKVTVLDWTKQNEAVAYDEYDANYFQHIPYLNTNNFEGDKELVPAAKVHYEKLCLYASSLNHKTLENGDTIEIVNDTSNIERALLLLNSFNILTINSSCYDSQNKFTFDTKNPNSCVTFLEGYENCSLTCIKESQLCASLPDYDFGVIPGNTALTGLDNLTERIVISEIADEQTISERANIIACKKTKVNDPKIIALVDAIGNESVKTYIETTFGASVLYHYENLL